MNVKENEDFLAKGMPEGSDNDDYDSESDDEKEIQDVKDKVKQMTGPDEDFEDEEDSDYEVEGDDNGLYDSNLDEVDELLHLKETVDAINSGNPQFFSHLTSLIVPDDLN